MKTLRSILLLVFVTTFFISCGGASDANNEATETTEPTTEATTGENPTTTNTTSTTSSTSVSSGASKITDAVVQQACDCQENARREDRTIDFAKVGECMGGKNKIQFVADLLGPDATEKERADAESALAEKMEAKCPK
ncbi:hypothetical protein [Aureispira sp. CCB-E]|uniref:hypothetical protein n=1 Tax=Aureispira sp. CCB-E TaxID=3051121 RepID=UPI002868C164|nr:hypothetical protein [Aureispira sp. CCB-E]WMX15806.1 hypothetical protein QP953_05335 [Aureispira sp. CCB-E]